MSFSLNLLNLSFLRGLILLSLFLKVKFSPDYNWPSDYLERNTNCNQLLSLFEVTNCENACDLYQTDAVPTFDYIIVGSGAAGSLLAYRLTLNNPNRTVLLIESGGDPSVDSVTPPQFVFNFNSTFVHNYFAEPSPNYGNAFKNGVNCYCGKNMGGSTETNAMMFVCGCDEDYNQWAAAANDSSWNYANILPLMKKSHQVKDPSGSLLADNCKNFQGTDGPLVLSNSDSSSDFVTSFLKKASVELNYRQKSSANCGPPFTGFANIPMSINDGRREGASRAFLAPLNDKNNFYFMRNSHVTKVITSKDSTGAWTATGVKVKTKLSKCHNLELEASREVIISAGSFNSPLILQRSGIGKAEDLNAFKIPQISDLPVGKNLMDHPIFVSYWTIQGFTTSDFVSSTYFTGQLAKYMLNFSGYFSRVPGLNFGGFINTINNSASCPDVQIIASGYEQNMVEMSTLINDKWGYKPEFANQILSVNKNSALIQVFMSVLHPKSRGTVNLRSCSDPYAAPIINGNYFSDSQDLDTLERGMKEVCKIFSTNAAKEASIKPLIFNIPECTGMEFCSSSYIRCHAKYFTMNEWHASGTCKMGSSANDSVVDNKLRVFGVKKLRVVDASVMPIITSGNLQCPTYTIAEKAAEMILADNP